MLIDDDLHPRVREAFLRDLKRVMDSAAAHHAKTDRPPTFADLMLPLKGVPYLPTERVPVPKAERIKQKGQFRRKPDFSKRAALIKAGVIKPRGA